MLPGVRAVGFTHRLPLSQVSDTASFDVEGYAPTPGEGHPGGEYRFVGGDYFRAMGIPILRGRAFEARDAAGRPRVAMIDGGLAREYFGGRDPLGRYIDISGGPHEIVGIVGTVHNVGLGVAARPQVYLPNDEQPLSSLSLVIDTDREPAEMAPVVRQLVAALDPQVPIYEAGSLGDRLGQSVARERFATRLLVGLASIGLALASVGIYALVAFWVTRESRQIGIRMALGATGFDVARQVVRMGLVPVSIGVVGGLTAAALDPARTLRME